MARVTTDPAPHDSPSVPPLGTRLETARLVLRPPTPHDVPELRAHLRRSAEHLRPWSAMARGGDDPASLTTLSRVVLAQRRAWRRGEAFAFLLCGRSDARILGRVSVTHVVRGVVQSGHLGYALDVHQTGQGYATEAVRAVVDFVFAPLGLHRVQAAVMPSNVRSIRVLEKLRFRREGLALRYLLIAGRWEDHFIYARTVED